LWSALGRGAKHKTKALSAQSIHYLRKVHTELYRLLRSTVGNAELILFSIKFRQCL